MHGPLARSNPAQGTSAVHDLADYEAAFDRIGRDLELRRDWGRVERRVRRRIHAPTFRLATTLAILVLCVTAGSFGVTVGWLVAIGLVLAVLPGRIADVRRRRSTLRHVDSAADVRALCRDEARRAMAGAFLRALLFVVIGALYLLTALVAAWRDKSPWPGVIAGTLLLAWAAGLLFVAVPRASAEARALDGDTESGDAD
jgi:hypothetical protein